MKQKFLKKEGRSSLVLFFSGWGTEPSLLDELTARESDVLMCYDYRKPDFDRGLLSDYKAIRVCAWSMGVWIAGSVLDGLHMPWDGRIAVNGTPWPIHDRYGIPESVFYGTLTGFSESVLQKFRRRMCGSSDSLARYMSHASNRSPAELRDELVSLEAAVRGRPSLPDWQWDQAVAGRNDRIFPFENQQYAWKKLGISVIGADIGHYDARLLEDVLNGNIGEWIRN